MYYIQINFCQIETSKMDKVPHETKYTSVWCFSLNKLEDHPLLETLSQHISLTDLDCSRGFVRCFPYVFQSNSQGTLDMRFPSIDLQCFKVCYFQMAGENCVETRMRREDTFFEFFGFGMILITSKCWWFSPKNCGHDPFKTMPCRCWGVLHLFSLAMEMVDSCFIHIESRRSVSGTNGRVHSCWRFLHLHSQNSVSKAAILGTAMESPKKKRIFKKT